MEENNDQINPQLSPEEELELQKLRMKAKFGSEFGGSESLPPELELEWLKQVESFEDAYSSMKRITVREILGDIIIKNPEDIPVDHIQQELDELLDKMAEKGIELDVLCQTPADIIYKFIFDELLSHETDDMGGTGFTTHFCYEEFHPNAEYDITHLVEDFLRDFCTIDYYDHVIFNLDRQVIDSNGNLISREEMLERIRPFGEAFEKPKIKQWNVKKLDINDDKTEAEYEVDLKYSVKSRDTGKNTTFNGLASFLLLKDDMDYWGIRKFIIPGLSV